MFFHCSELIDSQHRIKMSDEVQFTVLPDQMAESKVFSQICDIFLN